MDNKRTTMQRLAAWFGLGALMFGTYCGANMASGVYAAAYIVTLGGGWMWVWLLMFAAIMSFFCVVGLDFVRSYKVTNYNEYYLALYNLNKPGSNKALKTIVSLFFDIWTMMLGVVTTAATIALFAELCNSLLGMPLVVAKIIAVVMFAILTIYGAGFLRKFNTIMTISLVVSLIAIVIAVINNRGEVLAERIGNFNLGLDWTGTTVAAHFSMFFSYCMTTASWGSSLSNYADQMHDKKDAIGSGIMIGVMVTTLFLMTGMIVLPYMPEVMAGTPILMICQKYLSPALTIFYWVAVMLSVISTAPTFTYNFTNRWVQVWKTEKVSRRVKFFVLSASFLAACWLISSVGLLAIVQKGYVLLGDLALPTMVIPMLISIYRVAKKDRAEKAALKENTQA